MKKTEKSFGSGEMEHEIISVLSEAVRRHGGNRDDLRCLLTDESLANRIAKIIVSWSHSVFDVVMNYASLSSDLIAVGRHNVVDEEIRHRNFPLVGRGVKTIRVRLYSFSKVISGPAVLGYFKARNIRAAKSEELFAFTAQHPEMEKAYPLVALGNPWRVEDDTVRVTCAMEVDGVRRLETILLEHKFDPIYRFLGVPT